MGSTRVARASGPLAIHVVTHRSLVDVSGRFWCAGVYGAASLTPRDWRRAVLSGTERGTFLQLRHRSAKASGIRLRLESGGSPPSGRLYCGPARGHARPSTARSAAIAKSVTHLTGDLRWRVVFINNARDDDGNIFSFAMDGGVTYRRIARDIATGTPQIDALLRSTLGTTRRTFWGSAFGLYLNLGQVSAFAELQKLGIGRKSSTRVESRTGWQPLI